MKIPIYIKIIRPTNCIITAFSVAIGIQLVTETLFFQVEDAFFALFSAFLVAAFGNVVNDIFDINIDKVNRPHRPLPSGKISVNSAKIYSMILLFMGLFFAVKVGRVHFSSALFISFLLFLYSKKYKKSPFIGNLIVAFISGYSFIYGSLVVTAKLDLLKVPIIIAIFASLFHLSREILKDIDDIKGDLIEKARTSPILLGENFAENSALVILLILIGLTYIPYDLRILSVYYLVSVIFLVDLPILGLIIFIKRKSIPLTKATNLMKLIMITGILSVLIGKFC